MPVTTWSLVAMLVYLPTTSICSPEVNYNPFGGIPLRVVSLENPPYLILNAKADSATNPYIGFVPDMLNLLADRHNLNITLYLQPDGRYGTYNKTTETWNGLIGELAKEDGADLAAAALTHTSQRELAVDFVQSFQHHGITMLLRKPAAEPDKDIWQYTFDIVKPMKFNVWAMCTFAAIVVGFFLWFYNCVNPYEWSGRHNIGRATEAEAESFKFQGAMWFAFTSLQWQGFERAPRSAASKVLMVFWFIFVTITLVTYTGAMVNTLFWASSVHGMEGNTPDINSLADLVKSDYDYGFIKGGSTNRYFMKVSKGDIFTQMRKYWKKKGDSVLVSSTSEGVKRAEAGNYVFFLEKYSAEYNVNQHPCDLMTVGDLIGRSSYGFAVSQKMDRDLYEKLSVSIVNLIEEGDISFFEKKWWKVENDCWKSVKENTPKIQGGPTVFINEPKVVTMKMFWGPFVMLTMGILATALITGAETLYYKYRGKYLQRNRPGGSQLQIADDENMT